MNFKFCKRAEIQYLRPSMNWIFKKKEIRVAPKGFYGFVYVIIDDKGTPYWGKKAFQHKRKRRLGKKARKSTRKRVVVEHKDSGWKDYWGSCKPLLEYIKKRGSTEGFQRIILKFCKDRQSLSYWETHYLFTEKAIFIDSWNGHVLRFFKGRIHE